MCYNGGHNEHEHNRGYNEWECLRFFQIIGNHKERESVLNPFEGVMEGLFFFQGTHSEHLFSR